MNVDGIFQDALEKTKIECQQMIAQREEGLMELTKAVTSIKVSIDCKSDYSKNCFLMLCIKAVFSLLFTSRYP